VFTQFSKTISVLRRRLVGEGFGMVVLDGSMSMPARKVALEKFLSDPGCTILVLSIRSGAIGLTLTNANHVFILDPCINPSLTAQAINRVRRRTPQRGNIASNAYIVVLITLFVLVLDCIQVHRVGQTKQVTIHHLVMADSVEQRILEQTRDKLETSHREADDGLALSGRARNRFLDSSQMRTKELAALFA
jgi:SNF2 family DNA or RNA helicase